MNRKIEFRAWDKEAKEYYFNAEYIYDFRCSGRGCYAESFGELLEHPERYEVEQYTGLKDKNGKEIYEGDIVKINGWWNAAGPAGYDENQCVVEWDDRVTGFSPFNNYDCDCGVYHDASDCEVIGNIHENPELLEDKK